MVSTLFPILIAFGAFQALLLGAVLFIQPNRSLAKKCFAGFLLIEGIILAERLLFETGYIVDFPHLLGVAYPISFLKPPLLLFMALATVAPDFRFRKIHLLHLIPFLIFFALNIPFYGMGGDEKMAMTEAFMNQQPGYDSFGFYLNLSFFFNIGIYMAVAISQLRKYRVKVKNHQMANWYLRVLYLYGLGLVLGFFYYVQLPAGWLEIPTFNTLSMLTLTFMIQTVAYGFLTRSQVLTQRPPNPALMNNDGDPAVDLLNQLKEHQLYLDDSLDLAKLSDRVGLPAKQVSDLVNQRFGKNIKSLVNEHRVAHAIALMKEDKDTGVQLIDIGLESGFNNKVSFYRSFKRHTGKSPSEYWTELKSHHPSQQ